MVPKPEKAKPLMPLRALLPALSLAVAACASPEPARPPLHLESGATPDADTDETLAAPDDKPIAPITPLAPSTPPPPPTPDIAPASLASLSPWFGEPSLEAALASYLAAHEAAQSPVDAALADAALAQASEVFKRFADAHPTDTRALPARFMAAWIASEASLHPESASGLAATLEQLARDWPLMADALTSRAARVHLAAGQTERAEALLVELAKTSASIHAGLALDLHTALLVQKGRSDAALALLESAHPDALAPASWQRLVDLRPAGPSREAARLELARRHPDNPLGKAAWEALDKGLIPTDKRLGLGRTFFEVGRYEAMRTALSGLPKGSPAACEAAILQGRALDRTNRKKADKDVADRAFSHYERALSCQGEARADATFLGGRNRVTRGDLKLGKTLLEAHTKEFPTRSTADDARLLLATEVGDKKRANKALLAALKRYPEGDMADSIAWELVGPHVEKRRWPDVLKATSQVLAASPEDVPGRHGGRYRYWHARALWEVGRAEEARAEWRKVFENNPLSWYAVLAYSRLVKAPSDPGARVDDALLAAIASAQSVLSPEMRGKLWADPHYRRALEWARLSGAHYDRPSPFHEFIDAELDAVAASARPPAEAWDWAHVEVDQLAGAWARSMRLARNVESAGELAFPKGEIAEAWRLAYPRPFEGLVTRWANERGLLPHWIWAVMRVESNFDPTAVSWANAIGIMQIILPTAKSLARDTSHEPTRDNLMRPAVAVELGTKYLAKLLDRHKVYPLASAGYNAGGGAVSKWRKQFGDVDIDEFVERIPYREANLYAKSVTQTLARYLWLYEGRLLALDLVPIGAPSTALAPTE
jgi:soluble lytic murein transglycosylase